MVVGRIANDVVDVRCTACLNKYFAVQTAHPPLVLVFDVALCTPLRDDDCNVVVPALDKISDVVFAGQSTVSSIAHPAAVDVQDVRAFCATDVQDNLAAVPARRDLEWSPVDPGWVLVWQRRWRPVEGHLHVRVLREVAGVLHGPVTGHRNATPRL